jgi:NAD(P)-dependent dehydrogenase (short-subunit alcohol dehydrogenase family)
MSLLDGKVAVVTGAASGIGEGTVRRFVEEGARVVIADIQDGPGHQLAEELGPSTTYLHTDVSQEDDVRGAVQHAVGKWGKLDCIFNNAGFGGVSGPIEETDTAGYDATMAVLLRGVFLGIKHASAVMKQQRSGSIVSTASVAGLQAGFGPHVYSAAKAAVIHLTRSVSVELGPFGVRANAICPGIIVTNIFTAGIGVDNQIIKDAVRGRLGDAFAGIAPMQRAGLPLDIADAAAWLASDHSSYVTGQAITVDGGLTAGRDFADFVGRIAGAYGLTPEQFQQQIRTQG